MRFACIVLAAVLCLLLIGCDDAVTLTKLTTPTEPGYVPPVTRPAVTDGYDDPTHLGRFFILNHNTMRFHYNYCYYITDIKPENRQDYYGLRSQILKMGFSPCEHCNP